MFTCPKDDIHSVFIDGEIPEKYLKEYLEHLDSCPKCKNRAESLKGMHGLLQKDAQSIRLDEKFIDESYARLMTKLRHSKNSARSRNVIRFPEPAKYIVPAAAAAALVAFVLPVANSGGNAEAAPAAISAIKRPQGIQASFAENPSAKKNMSSLLSEGGQAHAVNFVPQNSSIVDQKVMSDTKSRHLARRKSGHDQLISSINDLQEDLAAVDMFRPEFEQEPVTITISLGGLSAKDLSNATIRLQASPDAQK